MLSILYRKAPTTTGIFRKSAAARMTRMIKEKLNEGNDNYLTYCEQYRDVKCNMKVI